MSFLSNCIKGIFIGAGAILPGLSSGVLCVVFGIYETLLDSILNFFQDVKKNIKFLFPLLIGGFLGVFAFGNLLNYVLYQFPLQTKSIFIGLILGNIPSLLKTIHKTSSFKYKYLPFFFISLFFGIGAVFLENILNFNYNVENVNLLYLFFCGICMSAGVIIPGVSSTVILSLFGIYHLYLFSISTIYLPFLIPLAFGLILGSFVFMKLTKFLLNKYTLPTYYAILGFSVGSIFILFPSICSVLEFFIFIACIILGMLFFSP